MSYEIKIPTLLHDVALSELTITCKLVFIRQWETLAVPDTYFLKIGYREDVQNLWKLDEHIYLGNKFIFWSEGTFFFGSFSH